MIVQAVFRIRRGLAANWTATNPVLKLGEPGLETDTRLVKYGDGVTAWNSLAYAAASLSSATKAQFDAALSDGNFLFADALDTDGTLSANSDLKIATQKATKTYVDALIAAQDAMVFKGVIDCSTNPNYPAADRGHTYRVSVAGKIGGASGPNVEAGDTLLCLTDATASGTHATVGANWGIIQANLDGAVIGPASATDNGFARFDGTTGKLIKNSPASITASEISDGTTVGRNLLKLTNPGAITFLRANADNTVTARSASDFRGDLALGSAALKNTGTSGDAVPILNGGATTWAAGTTWTGAGMTIRVNSTGVGLGALARTMPGVEIVTGGMNSTSARFGGAVKFMSTDPDLSTENPKFLAGIVARATEVYDGDTKGGMVMDLAVTDNAPGATSIPVVVGTVDPSGINLVTGKALRVNSQQVVGGRLTALPADATDLATAIALVNAIKARMKVTGGHGLVAD